jgi:hypothetical protein
MIQRELQENLQQNSLLVRLKKFFFNLFICNKFNLGTKFLTKQLATGVVMAENLIEKASKNVHDKIVPNSEPVKINRGLHVTARGLRSTSNATVKASSYVGRYFQNFYYLVFFSVQFSIKNR